jgi:hypothetical protein
MAARDKSLFNKCGFVLNNVKFSFIFRREESRAEITRKEMAALESASAGAADVTNAMMAMKIELEEKKRTNELLQRALVKKNIFPSKSLCFFRLTYYY